MPIFFTQLIKKKYTKELQKIRLLDIFLKIFCIFNKTTYNYFMFSFFNNIVGIFRTLLFSRYCLVLNINLYICLVINYFAFFKKQFHFINASLVLLFLNIIALFLYDQKIQGLYKKFNLLERSLNSSSFVIAVMDNKGQILFKNDLFGLLFQNKKIENLENIIDFFGEYHDIKSAIQKGISCCLLGNVFNYDINLSNKKYRLYMSSYNIDDKQYTVFCIYDLTTLFENENIDKIIAYLLHHINVGMILTKKDGEIIFANNLANNMMKIHLSGKNIHNIDSLSRVAPSVKTKINVSHGFYINITMQKYFSEYYFYKLEQEEFKINSQLEEAPFGVVVLDLKLNICSMNKYLMRYISNKKFNHIKDLVADFQSEQFVEYLKQFTQGKEPNPTHFKLFTKEGPYNLVFVKNIKNEYLTLYCIEDKFMRDHHNQVMHQQRLNSLGEIVCGVSHDFNNIITTILGLSDMILERNVLLPNSADYVDLTRIKHSACKAANLIKQMLNISRKQQLSEEVLDLNETINEFLSTIGRLFEENIEINFQKNKNIPLLYISEVSLEQILINLIKNAKDSMKYGGNITIKTDLIYFEQSFIDNGMHISSGKYVEISISDSGCGIPRENMKKIFDPFFSNKGDKGNGMGLSNVLSIVQQHNGFIKVKSKINVGSTFYVYLPHYEIEKTTNTENISLPEIMIVEDEDAIRQFATNGLKKKGYNVISTGNPEEALSMAHDKIYLAILDILLPKMNGHIVYKNLKKKNPKIKVIFISGFPDEDRSEYQNDKNVFFLAKPFSFKELSNVVKSVVGEPDNLETN